jgi:tryptophan synthase alpha subunit
MQIHRVTPTMPRDRAAVIARRSTGSLYCVSVAAITGERDRHIAFPKGGTPTEKMVSGRNGFLLV